jgi:hypothetical protein
MADKDVDAVIRSLATSGHWRAHVIVTSLDLPRACRG